MKLKAHRWQQRQWSQGSGQEWHTGEEPGMVPGVSWRWDRNAGCEVGKGPKQTHNLEKGQRQDGLGRGPNARGGGYCFERLYRSRGLSEALRLGVTGRRS